MNLFNRPVPVWVHFYVLLMLLLPASLYAISSEDAADELIQKASDLQLANDPGWLSLLHYKEHVFGGVYSQADDTDFFLADNGAEDAAAELKATLKALLADQQARCRFPARLHWLDAKLNLASYVTSQPCTEFEQWKQKLAVSGVTLVFPAMYLGNPASMFGHTFLRLDQKNKPVLLNYTLSYAARTDPDDGALAYVFKGLAGGYTGVFAVQPYFETVQSYGDIEHRDIWEYSLNLSQAEVDQMIRHVWEIRSVQFDYYFLRENCSYRLLSLLDVARPGTNMTHDNQFPLYAAPVDTVRAVMAAGFVQQKQFRPAISSRITQMYAQLSEPARDKVFHLLDNRPVDFELDNFQLRQQAQILELTQEIGEFKQQDSDAAVLSARSRIDLGEQATFLFEAISADQGHGTARWHVSYGEENKQSFVELGIRPVFHDLLDKPDGFVKGAAVSVLDTRLRWFDEQEELQLERLSLFNMQSLSAVSRWHWPLSARLDLTVRQQSINTVIDAYVMHLDTGLGLSAAWGDSLFYLLASMSVEHSGYFEKNHSGYLGGEAGFILPFSTSRLWLGVQTLNGVTGEKNNRDVYKAGYQFELKKDHALRLDYALIKYDQLENKSFDLKYLVYF
ncbi:MAG: DUF4105 domain-containing protein [Gammaproteobacteria bacterium]|nr:DUF4105 domain-containing protein [Gammaproteobacteria bacterium]